MPLAEIAALISELKAHKQDVQLNLGMVLTRLESVEKSVAKWQAVNDRRFATLTDQLQCLKMELERQKRGQNG